MLRSLQQPTRSPNLACSVNDRAPQTGEGGRPIVHCNIRATSNSEGKNRWLMASDYRFQQCALLSRMRPTRLSTLTLENRACCQRLGWITLGNGWLIAWPISTPGSRGDVRFDRSPVPSALIAQIHNWLFEPIVRDWCRDHG